MEMSRNMKLVAAASAGLLAGILYLLHLHALRREIVGGREMVSVLAASEPLGMGELLTPEAIRPRSIPRSALPQRAILPQDAGLVMGRSLLHPLPAGETLLWTDLPEGPRLRFGTEEIPLGFRAMAFPADEVRTVAHLLSPGDRVDIAWSRAKGEGARLETTLIAERVLVLGVGGRTTGVDPALTDGSPSTVTLLVPPDLGLTLVQAMQTGEVFFLVRNRDDGGDTRGGQPRTAAPREE